MLDEKKKPPNAHRITPQPVIDAVHAFTPVALDPCWNEYALTDAEFVCDGVEVDGLTADWGAAVRAAENHLGGGVFINPPWSDPLPWVQKVCAEHAADPTLDILLWLPMYPETQASSYIWQHAKRICIWGKRINHPAPPINGAGALVPGGEVEITSGSMLPTWLCYFGPRHAAFEKAFRSHGTVVWGWNIKAPRSR